MEVEDVLLINHIGLIGDFMGTIPAMIAEGIRLAEHGKCLYVAVNPMVAQLFDLIPKKYVNIRLDCDMPRFTKFETKWFNLQDAFMQSHYSNCYQTRVYFEQIGLPDPGYDPRPEIDVPPSHVPKYDYIFAPHSRSLPPNQKWDEWKWNELARRLGDKKIAVFGNPQYDTPFIQGSNVTNEYGRSFIDALNMMKKARALLCGSTGPSHWAFALDTPNVLLINQGPFCKNPAAIKIEDPIPGISVERVHSELVRF